MTCLGDKTLGNEPVPTMTCLGDNPANMGGLNWR